MKKIIQRGAEAILYLTNNKLVKERIRKGYRHQEIDKEIRKRTTRKEARLLEKANGLIPVPKIFKSSDKETRIEMEFINGNRVKDIFDSFTKMRRINVCKQIGRQIASLHKANIIHGDLTTSNMILKKGKLYFIDFGLGFISTKIEDKAVDLHLLKQALESKHYRYFEESFKAVLSGYRAYPKYKEVMQRFQMVEKRGRYKRKNE